MNDDIDRILSTKNIKDLKRALSAIRKKLKTGTIDVIGMELSPEELTAFNKGMSDMLSFFKKWGISIKNLDDFILGEFGPLPYLQYKNELGHVKLKGLADFKSRKKLFSLADSYITSYQSLFNTVSKIQQASFKIELDKIIDSIKNDEDFTPPSVEVVDQLLRKYAGIKREDVDNVIKTYINFIRVAILEQNEYFFKNTKNLKGHVLIYTTTLHVKRLKSMFEKDGREVESEEIWPSDAAMMTVSLTKKINSPLGQNKEGGIDLTPANMNLQVNHDTADAFQFHLDPAMLAQLQNAPGFVPVIINIQPLKSLPEFLELAQNPKNL